MTTTTRLELIELVDRLADLTDAQAAPDVAEVRRRLHGRRFRVLVAGEAKRGKSTLVNALLGRELLPTGAVPVTAVATTVMFGRPARVLVRGHDGAVSEHPVQAVAEFVTESGNPHNRRGVAEVSVLVEHPLLADGVELVDTPGTGSVHGHNDEEAHMAYRAMDAAVFVLTADPPISASELDLFHRLVSASVRVFVLLNKMDRLDALEAREAIGFVREVLAAAGVDPQLYPCSARQALAARTSGAADGDSGLGRFESDLHDYLGRGRDIELHRSLTRRSRAIAAAVLDGLHVVLAVDAMRTAEEAARVAEFTTRLHRVRQRGAQAADLAATGMRRLLGQLNSAAAAAEPVLAGQVVAVLSSRLDVEMGDLDPGQLQRIGRECAVELVHDAVEVWRRGQERCLEQGAADLQRRLLDDLAAELTGIQKSARELLDLELSAEPDRSLLLPDPRFTYLLDEQAGQTELLAGAIRRRLPGRWGRQRVSAHLVEEADRLTRQQVGRVRADLQARLRDGTHTLVATLAGRYAASFARLTEAMETARLLSAETEGGTGRCTVAARAAALEELLADLDRVAVTFSEASSPTGVRSVRADVEPGL